MAIKSDKWIKEMAESHGMIEPFQYDQVKQNETGSIVSYGTSSYGYDVRCSDEFKIFTNINSAFVDLMLVINSIILFISFAYSKGGIVSGFISDSSSGEALIGANVMIQETGQN